MELQHVENCNLHWSTAYLLGYYSRGMATTMYLSPMILQSQICIKADKLLQNTSWVPHNHLKLAEPDTISPFHHREWLSNTVR